MTPANAHMLILARESRGLSQTELARRLKVTQGYISKLESGLIEVPLDRIDSIANVLDYPPEFFEQQPRFGESPCLFHRKRQTLPVSDLKRIEAEVTIAGLVVRNLMHGIEVEAESTFPVMDIDEYESPEAIARLVRRHWHLPSGPIRNLVRTIEAAGGIVVRHTFGTQKIDAISQWPSGEAPLFVVNADIPWDRVRFTLAHELGHLVMHSVPSSLIEAEADRFAAEFLMPEEEIAPQLAHATLPRLAQLKAFWRVSMAALARRAHDVGAITERQYRYLFMQIGRLGYRKVEPNPIEGEEPTVLLDALDVHERVHGLDPNELARVAKIREPELKTKYGARRTLRVVPSSA